MGASKFLQKKANTRAKEIDKKYGEGQYGGTWWQDMEKNNDEMGESPSESFLQRKMKEINSARTVTVENTAQGSKTQRETRVVGSPGGTFLGGFSYKGKKRREKTAAEIAQEQEQAAAGYREYKRLATMDLNAQEAAVAAAKEKAAQSREKYNIHAFGAYDSTPTKDESNYSKLLADLNKAKSIQYDIKGRKELDALTAEQTDALDRLSKASRPQTSVMATNQTNEAAALKAKSELEASGLSDEKIRELLGYHRNIPKREKNAEMFEDIQGAAEAYAETNPVLATVASVGSNLTSGIGAIGATFEHLLDPDTPVDYHGGAFLPYAYTSGVRDTVSKNLETDHGKAASFAYGVGTSMLDSAATVGLTMAGVPAWLATSTLGGAAATSAMQEAKDRGLDDDRAIWTGLLAGAAETAFEKISLESLTTMKAPTGTVRQKILGTLKNTAKQAGIEGSEEVFTDFANLISDGIVNGNMSQIQQTMDAYVAEGMSEAEARDKAVGDWIKDTAVDFAAGALAGGLMGGASNAVSRISQNAEAEKAYAGREQELLDESKELNPDNDLAKKYQERLDNGKKLSGRQLMRLIEQNETDTVASDKAKIQSAAEGRLTQLGETGDAAQIAQAITKQVAGEKLSTAEQSLIDESRFGRRVANEIAPENVKAVVTKDGITPRDTFASEWTGKLDTKRIYPEVFNRLMPQPQKTGETTTRQEGAVTGAKYNAETGRLDAIVTNEAGEVKTVPAAEAEMTPMQEELFDWADELKLEAAGPLMVRAYQPEQNMELYTRSFKLAYEYGKAGMPMDYVEKSEGVNYLHPTQIKLAYEEGQAATQRKVQAREEKIRSGGTTDSTTRKKGSVSLRGATVGSKTYAPVNRKTVDSRQWASVKAMRAFSRAVGVDVVFYQSQANERGVYEGANGFYKGGKLYLDINAGRDTVGMTETAILKTAAHELTHFIQANSAQYEALKSFVVNKLTHEEGVSFEDLVADKQRREPGLEYDEAVDEVVADACEMMLGNSTVVEQLAKENRSLAEKIRDWLREWVENLKIALEGLQADRTESRAMMQYARELQEIWDNALMDAAKNNRGTVEAESRQQARVGTDAESGKPIYQSNFPKGTPKAAKAQRILSLIQNVWSKKPISLVVQDADGSTRTIEARFDPTYIEEEGVQTDAKKLMGGNRHGTSSEQRVTLDLADDYYEIAVESTYNYSKSETGKSSATHEGVKQWHYFVNDILFQEYGEKETTPYRVTINVKERSDGEFVYSFSAERQNERSSTRRTLHADVNQTAKGGEANAQPSVDSIRQSNDNSQEKSSDNKNTTADPDIRYQQRDNLKEEYHLTDDEESAIISYKSGDSYTLNGKLTARAELTEYQRKLRDNLDAALEKLPVYRGEVYRHYNFDDFGGFDAMQGFLRLFRKGKYIDLGGYLSCSTVRNEDRTQGEYTVNMVIQSENGRRLAGFGRNTENEILLPRDTQLVPYRMERMGKTSIRIYVREDTNGETGKTNDSALPDMRGMREGTQGGENLRQVPGGDPGKVQSEVGRSAGRDGDRRGVPGLREGEGSGTLDATGVDENHRGPGTRGGEGEGVKNQQREPRLSDRDVLSLAADMALRQQNKSWTPEDRNRLEIFTVRLRRLEEAQAELKALKEERKDLLDGRKASEVTKDERIELTQNRNRTETQRGKIQRLEEETYKIESVPQVKALLKKSRSIVEREADSKARAEFREAREKQEMLDVTRRKVERNAKRLLEYMNTNTDKKHIPEALKKPIGELLESLDFYSNSARKGGNKTRADQRYCEAMQGLQSALAAQKLFDDTGEGTDLFKGYLDLPAGFESMLGVHVERVKTAMEKHPLKTDIVRKMDLDDLRDLDVILSVMSRSVTKMNEMFVNRRFAYVADAAEDSIESMDRLGQHQDKAKGAEQFALWDNTLPWYAFQRFGEGGKAVFEGLQDGWDKLAFNMKTVLDFRQELIKDTVARKWDTETHKVELTDPDGATVTATLTTAQLMSLYCLSKRKQALGHLLGGGIRPAAIELTDTLGDRVRKRSLTQDKQYKLTDESLGQLLKLLTPEQKKIADAMQKFMTEQGSAWGNAVTMARFGYRGFTEQNYFPIETDAQDRQAKTGDTKEGSLYRLQNISAVKPLVKNANNALILRGIFDVFANHTADIAKYNAMVLPIIDAQKWYNYKYASKNEAGQVSTRTVQRAMTRAYGGAANSFVIKYMQDLNGVKESGDRGDTLPKKMISNYKRAMVAANMRVALLQPTAYVRASAVLDYKYLVKAFADKTGTKQTTKEMLENSGIALWKSLGFFDTDVGRSVRDQIKGKSGKLENLVDKTMIPAEKGDEITWARLWRACKLEVQDKQSLTGDELLKATAERFREVVYRTQVVDSTMTRSHMMRGSGTLSKMTTSFMSEPTVSYNMVMESTRQIAEDAKRLGMRVAIRRNWKVAGRAYQAYIVSAVVTAIVESLYDALRDSDDDDYLDKVWKAFGGEKPETVKDGILNVIFGLNGNLAGDINPIGKVPYLRDVVSILGGYSNGRMDTEAVANLKKAVDIWDEVIRLQTGDLDKATKTTYYGNMTTYGMIYPTAKALSQLTGLPGSAAMREIVTVWNSTVGAAWPNLKQRTYEDKQLREAWEKYGKASGVSYAVMYRATQDTKDFESDKDADGNTISGSLKAKYVEYIRSLGLPRAQEKAVWEAAKVSSWSDKGTPWG